MSARPEPGAGILSIKPYVGGKGGHMGGKVYKLSSNESALGPSAAALEAYQRAAATMSVYPDGSQSALREAIAMRHGIDAARIVCGAGSDEILAHLAHAYLGPGDEAVYSAHGFTIYRLITLAQGATPVAAPERGLTADVDALLAAVTPRTRIVFLANPNNPTGTYLPGGELRRLHSGLASDVLLVIDAAYAEYVLANDYEVGIELVSTSQNVVMTRTFSKIYALAALRLGWAYCPAHIADVVNRLRLPFNLTTPTMEAGIAAIGDVAHVDASIAHNETWRARLVVEISALGLEVTPSVANFLLIGFPDGLDRSAADAEAFLANKGVFLRRVADYGLDRHLRMTVASEEANLAALSGLRAFLETT
ncbi:MAG: histidinol-phosphate transaminase [Rhizobiales bacterium]|nr:histidinol-phosphate transaminase [Hyphomicrobiales bacterium]